MKEGDTHCSDLQSIRNCMVLVLKLFKTKKINNQRTKKNRLDVAKIVGKKFT